MTWITIPGYPDYDVSDEGQVRSRRCTKSRILKHYYHRQGYPTVSLMREGKRRCKLVHHLVLLAFVGPRPDGMEIRHIDGDVTNNSLSNLAYGTRSENQSDRVLHGTINSTLTKRVVRVIRGLHRCGFTYARLSRLFTVSPSTIRRVVLKHTWANVD